MRALRREVFDEVFTVESAIAGAVFLAVLGAVVFAVVRRRAGARAAPSQRAERPRLESYYLGALVVVAAFLVAYSVLANDRQSRAESRPTVRVDVTAFQWCWQFRYPRQQDQPEPAVSTADCRGGHLPTLAVPTGRTVRIVLTSKDVIHSLWVPELRYKMDAFPHHTNTFTLKVDKAGRWIGRCAEYCGMRHYAMDFWFQAMSPEKYRSWLAAHHSGAAA